MGSGASKAVLAQREFEEKVRRARAIAREENLRREQELLRLQAEKEAKLREEEEQRRKKEKDRERRARLATMPSLDGPSRRFTSGGGTGRRDVIVSISVGSEPRMHRCRTWYDILCSELVSSGFQRTADVATTSGDSHTALSPGVSHLPRRVVLLAVGSTRETEIAVSYFKSKVLPRAQSLCSDTSVEVIFVDARTDDGGVVAVDEALDVVSPTGVAQYFERRVLLYFGGISFGWAPHPSFIKPDVRQRHRWLDGANLEMMQVIEGCVRRPESAYVMCLHDTCTAAAKAAKGRSLADQHLQASFQEFLRTRLPEHVLSYCTHDPRALTSFGQNMEERLLPIVRAACELRARVLPESIHDVHAIHMRTLACWSYRSSQVHALIRKVEELSQKGTGRVLSVRGPCGIGKSHLLAMLCQHLEAQGRSVVYHFAGVDNHVFEVGAMARRVLRGLRAACQRSTAEDWTLCSQDSACAALRTTLSTLCPPSPVVVVVDDLHSLKGMDAATRLSWLPPSIRLSGGVLVVTSVCSGTEEERILYDGQGVFFNASPIADEDERRSLLQTITSHHKYRLEDTHRDFLLAHDGSTSPLWLEAASQYVARWSVQTTAMSQFPTDAVEMFETVLRRAFTEFDFDARVLLCLVLVSKSGLTLSELFCLCSVVKQLWSSTHSPELPSPDEVVCHANESFSCFAWYRIFMSLRGLLTEKDVGGFFLISFSHPVVSALVLRLNEGFLIRYLRHVVAGFFRSGHLAALPERQATEVPYQWKLAGDCHRLADSLCEDCVLDHAWGDDVTRQVELIHLWRYAGDGSLELAGTRLAELVWKWDKAAAGEPLSDARWSRIVVVYEICRRMQLENRMTEVLDACLARLQCTHVEESLVFAQWVLFEAAQARQAKKAMEDALTYYRRALSLQEEAFGAQHAHVTTTLYHMARVCATLGRPTDALAHFQRCLETRLDLYGECDVAVAAVRVALGNLYADLGDNQSIQHFEIAFDTLTGLHGEHHSSTLESCYCFARALCLLNETAKAYNLLKRGIEVCRVIDGESHPRLQQFVQACQRLKAAMEDKHSISLDDSTLQRLVPLPELW